MFHRLKFLKLRLRHDLMILRIQGQTNTTCFIIRVDDNLIVIARAILGIRRKINTHYDLAPLRSRPPSVALLLLTTKGTAAPIPSVDSTQSGRKTRGMERGEARTMVVLLPTASQLATVVVLAAHLVAAAASAV
ncbi:hypothetical protein PR202_ga03018 [Eleusine coracana subsp. coracana]|uniref:Uncharacterized protein n=1 Tax=Eleusine coracana subsp. coracana TaxID=191504 RepID=A0AAV5BMH6_ELECO|nr:hypothetical protein PR202_ga03018 [Eleusine coracana subsp. coracana]